MKIRVLDRILVFLAGIVLILTGAAVVAERFFEVPVSDTLAHLLEDSLAAPITAVCVLVLLGAYCVCLMFRRYKGKRGFVVQRTEGGELSISIKAIENLVQKCIDKHEELHVMSTGLENSRDGLVIKLRIGLANGVSIPLVVSALQKQIKQYVTACSGVDVREVKVQVETASASLKASPFAVPDTLATPVAEKLANATQEPAAVNSPVTLVPPEADAAAKRPLHQRIFGREEQPMDVPAPPKAETAETASAHEPEVVRVQDNEESSELPAQDDEKESMAQPETPELESTEETANAITSEDAAEAETPEPVQPLENGFPTQLPEETEEERHEVAQ